MLSTIAHSACAPPRYVIKLRHAEESVFDEDFAGGVERGSGGMLRRSAPTSQRHTGVLERRERSDSDAATARHGSAGLPLRGGEGRSRAVRMVVQAARGHLGNQSGQE